MTGGNQDVLEAPARVASIPRRPIAEPSLAIGFLPLLHAGRPAVLQTVGDAR